MEISLERMIDCPFGCAQEYAEDYLHAIRPGRDVRFTARPDLTDRGKPHDELAVLWHSGSERFGDVDIVIRFRILRLLTLVLLKASSRDAPDMDSTPNQEAATRMFRDAVGELLQRLTQYAEERERQYCREHPPVRGPARTMAAV